jgi:hypothetical protein
MTKNSSIPPAVVQRSAALLELQPMRRGNIGERHMKCGKATCLCQQDAKARHGPYYTLTQAEGGKTRSRYVSEEQVPIVQRQIEAGREFRRRVDALWEACEQWADAELEPGEEAAEAAEKKGFRRRSKPRSRAQSKRS